MKLKELISEILETLRQKCRNVLAILGDKWMATVDSLGHAKEGLGAFLDGKRQAILEIVERECRRLPQGDAYDFDPDILRLQNQAPSPMPRALLWTLLALFFCLLIWSIFGRLDIIAVAQGKLVPKSSLKIVQPTDSGIVKEVLVREGDEVHEGQIVARMDALFSDADNRTLENALDLKGLQLRRIDAELEGKPLAQLPNDPPDLFFQVKAQYEAHRQAYFDAVESARAVFLKTNEDLQGALQMLDKLQQTVPIYREQETAYQKLAHEGYVSTLVANDKSRTRIEIEHDLYGQSHTVESLRSTIMQAEKQISQVDSNYRQELQNERILAEGEYRKLLQDAEKQSHRHELLELKAPQDGIVKDIATHTPGTVVSPGSILMTVVPKDDPIEAEVLVSHLDAGVVHPKQHVRVKLTAYTFQKYGMVEGEVRHVSPDALDADGKQKMMGEDGYRTIVSLFSNYLESNGKKYALTPGMQVTAEIHLGSRSILEYLLSPVKGTIQEAGRER